MKFTFITNACGIVEHDGYKLLMDPWLVPGAFGTWVHDPPLRAKPEDFVGVDALYISHIHPDHLCPETLKVFRRDIPIFTLQEPMMLTKKKLTSLGFTRVHAIHPTVPWIGLSIPDDSGPFTLRIFAPFTKHPFFADSCELGNVVDSALLIEAGGKKILNCNDNTPSVEAAKWLREEYGQLDVALLNFNCAGPYPACFDNLSADEKAAEADRLIARNLEHMAAVAKELRAWVTVPFAGMYKLGYGLEHLNPVLGTTTAEAARKFLNRAGVPAMALAEGEDLDLA